MKKIIFMLFLMTPVVVFSDQSESLKKYRENMSYWEERWVSALKCSNRYTVAMFIFDSTSEVGTHTSEVLSEIVEKFSIENPSCIIKSLRILPKEKIEIIIDKYYKFPVFNKPIVFVDITNKLRAINNSNTK